MRCSFRMTEACQTKRMTMNSSMDEVESVSSRESVPGFWLALAGAVFCLAFPFAAFIVAVVGMGMSVRAYRGSSVGTVSRRLAGAGMMLATAAILVVVFRDVTSLFW